MPSRRAVLGATAAAGGALAGCVSVSFNEDDGSDGWAELYLRPVNDAELGRFIEDELDVPEEVVDDVFAADEAFTTAPGAVPNGSGVEGSDGAIYELAVEATERRWSEYAIGFVELAGEAPTGATTVADLPAVDRSIVTDAFHSDDDTELDVGDGRTADVATTSAFSSSERGRSALAEGTVETVDRGGSAYEVHVERRAVLPGIATVAATRIASDAAGYGRQLREERAIELSGLSADERDVVEDATVDADADSPYDGGKRIEEPDEAFTAVVERLRDGGTVYDALDVWLVLHDGEAYVAELTEHGLQVGEQR